MAHDVHELREVVVDHERFPEKEVGACAVVAVGAEIVSPCRRQPVEPDAESVLEQQAEEEDRDADADQRGHGGEVVEQRVLALGGRHAQRNADADGESHSRNGQFDRRREAGYEARRDRDLIGRGNAQVTVQESRHVVEVLLVERSVEPETLTAAGEVGRRRMFAEDGATGVAGQQVQEDDQEQRQPDQDRDQKQQAADDVLEHEKRRLPCRLVDVTRPRGPEPSGTRLRCWVGMDQDLVTEL